MNCTYYYMYHIQLVLHILLLHLPHTLLLLLPILLLHLLHILLLHILLLLHLPHILLLHILLHVLHILHTTCAAVLYLRVFVCFRNRQRMYFAIKHLIEEPQNNFKIFKVRHLDTPTRTRPPDPWCLGCVFYNVCVCVCVYQGGKCIHGDRDEMLSVSSLLQKLRPYFTCGNGRNKTVLHDFIQVRPTAVDQELPDPYCCRPDPCCCRTSGLWSPVEMFRV